MAEITAQLVKELREKTGAGMMDCKKALVEVAGELEAAIDWLRKKGLSAAAKKAGRVAAEGLVAVASNGTAAAVVEVNAETDFVGRNEQFQAAVLQIAQLALAGSDDVTTLAATAYPKTGRTVQEELTNLIATVGENMSLRRVKKLTVSDGIVATYVHNAVAPNLGKIGVVVALESTADKVKLAELGKQLALHVAGAPQAPQALTIAEVDPKALEREKTILIEKAAASGKPEAMIGKIVEGQIKKYFDEIVLLEQTFVFDGKTKVSAVIEAAAKTLGAPVVLKAFARFQLGEGIEKESADFAAEVAKMAS